MVIPEFMPKIVQVLAIVHINIVYNIHHIAFSEWYKNVCI
jgi:hypothetical protein